MVPGMGALGSLHLVLVTHLEASGRPTVTSLLVTTTIQLVASFPPRQQQTTLQASLQQAYLEQDLACCQPGTMVSYWGLRGLSSQLQAILLVSQQQTSLAQQRPHCQRGDCEVLSFTDKQNGKIRLSKNQQAENKVVLNTIDEDCERELYRRKG